MLDTSRHCRRCHNCRRYFQTSCYLAFPIQCLPLHIHQSARIAAVQCEEPVKIRTRYPVAAQRTVRPMLFVALHDPLPHTMHLRKRHIIVHSSSTVRSSDSSSSHATICSACLP